MFTSNKRMLLEFAGVKNNSDYRAPGTDAALIDSAVENVDISAVWKELSAAPAVDAMERSFDAIGRTIDFFGGLNVKRRSLLLFSEGVSIDLLGSAAGGSPQGREYADRATAAMRRLLTRAQRAGVSVYTVDPRGLSAVSPEGGANDTARLNQWDSLRTIADTTGGQAVVGYNRFAEPFGRIVSDSTRYLRNGYYTNVPSSDKKFHKLSVHIRNRDYEVRTRSGFYADGIKKAESSSPSATSPKVTGLIADAVPSSEGGLPLTASASIVGQSAGGMEIQLVVEIDGRALTRGPDQGALSSNQVDVAFQAYRHIGEDVCKECEPRDLSSRTRELERSCRSRLAILDDLPVDAGFPSGSDRGDGRTCRPFRFGLPGARGARSLPAGTGNGHDCLGKKGREFRANVRPSVFVRATPSGTTCSGKDVRFSRPGRRVCRTVRGPAQQRGSDLCRD